MEKKIRIVLSGVLLVIAASLWFAPLALAREGCEPNLQFLRYKGFANGLVFAPGQEFSVTFSVRNNSDCRLGSEHVLALVKGDDRMGAPDPVNPQLDLAPGQEGDIYVELTAPSAIGEYESAWQLALDSTSDERYGDPLTIRIRVAPSPVAATAQANETIVAVTGAAQTAAPTRNAASTVEANVTATELPPTTRTEVVQPTGDPAGTATAEQSGALSPTGIATLTPTPSPAPATSTPTPAAATQTTVPPATTPIISGVVTKPAEPTMQPTQAPIATATPSPLPSAIPENVQDKPTDGTSSNDQILPLAITVALALLFLVILVVAFRLWRRGKEQMSQAAITPQSNPKPVSGPVPQVAQLAGAVLAEPLLLRDPTLLGSGDGMDSKFVADAAGLASVSPEHARIERRNNRWLIQDGVEKDRPSQKGIFVNDKRTRANYLSDGDKIRLGRLELIFREPPQGANQ